jgi:predicted transposase/invertase (TIGR01784 family)
MKTDKWFYELFLSQPGMLVELVPGIKPDWEFIYGSPVVKEKEFRLDGVFTPVSDDPTVPIVFVEAQMQSDSRFYGRYFAEVFTYLAQYEISHRWQGLLILRSRRQYFGAELSYDRLLDQQVTRLYLSDLKKRQGLGGNLALLQLLVVDQEKSTEIGKMLLSGAETEAEFQRRLTLIETILVNKFPELTKEIIMQMLDLKAMDITQSRFYQEIIQEGREQGREQGLEQGLQRGLDLGLQRGEAQLIIRQLERRFGKLSANHRSLILGLSVPQLEDLGELLLDFTTIADLGAWLGQMELNDSMPRH